MNSNESLNASFSVMILMQAIGSFDPMPGTGPRKMPAPKVFVTVIIAWFVLQIAADIGWEKQASMFGWLIVLAGTVLGPFGKRVTSFLGFVVNAYGSKPVSLDVTNQPTTTLI